jgi:hypothetical protein
VGNSPTRQTITKSSGQERTPGSRLMWASGGTAPALHGEDAEPASAALSFSQTFAQSPTVEESNGYARFHDPNCEAPKVTVDHNLDALLEADRFVRLMAAASGPEEILRVIRAYLASWSKERIIRVQATDAGWAPFDEYRRAFPIASVSDVRKISGPLRIRFRELKASDMRIAPELLELDLFFFFAEESLAVHASVPHTRVPARSIPTHAARSALVNL